MYRVLLVLCLIVLLAGCSGGGQAAVPTFVAPTPRATSASSPFLTRPTYVVTTDTLTEEIIARGELVAQQQANLAFSVNGTLSIINAVPGQQVSAGAVLAELDAPTQKQALLQRQSDLAIAKLTLESLETSIADDLALAEEQVAYASALVSAAQAQSDNTQEATRLQRAGAVTTARLNLQKLQENGAGGAELALAQEQIAQAEALAALPVSSDTAVIQQRSALAAAQLNLEKLEAAAESGLDLDIAKERVALAEALTTIAQEQYEETILRAPFAGTITAINVQQGNQVNAYDTLGIIANLDAVEARGMLPVESRDRVALRDPAQVRIYGYGSQTFTGTVTELAEEATVWEGGLAYQIIVTLDKGQLLPAVAQVGADIIALGEVHENVPWIPSDALITLGSETYLDLLTENGIQRTVVEIGITQDQRTEIVSGIQAGDTVVFP